MRLTTAPRQGRASGGVQRGVALGISHVECEELQLLRGG